MSALTKADLAEYVSQEMGLNKREALHLVELFFEEIRRTLSQGSSVKLSGFGNFELRDKSERPGRNPKTGEMVPVSARRVVTFRSGLKLRQEIAQRTDDDLTDPDDENT